MPGADQVVMRACEHYEAIACLDLMGRTVDYDHASARLAAKELIGVVVDFAAKRGARCDGHHNQLQFGTRIKNSAKIDILLRQVLNISEESNHETSAFRWSAYSGSGHRPPQICRCRTAWD